MLKIFAIVLGKELRDALRDRRTLARLLIPAVIMGPLMLMVISNLVSSLEAQAEQREVMAVGIDNAPTLRNYLERQTYKIKTAPADYEEQLRKSRLNEPVLVVGQDFEKALADGDRPKLEIVSDSANQRASVGVRTLNKLVEGFAQERGGLALMLRGVPTGLLQPVEVHERDLASAQARASQITGMIPMFIIMAVLYGALTAALDSTAGERERGSLEPLLMNPVPHFALVLGKWGAVALLGMAVAVLANLGYVPAQDLIHNETLQAMFRFGPAEALRFLLLQLPLAAGLSALLMAVAIRSKTYKEAQAGSALVITGISLAPMVAIMNPGAEPFWYYLVPGLGQYTLMMQVLKGQALQFAPVATTVAGGIVLMIAGLAFVARSMRSAVAR
ncbi:MAG: ABC transporter permease [Pelomonas sp.]|nr:ABC transporter permease [Roseateles sp.]